MNIYFQIRIVIVYIFMFMNELFYMKMENYLHF